MEPRIVLASLVLAASAVAGGGSGAPAATGVSQASDAAADPTLVPGAVTAPPAGGPLGLTALNLDFQPKELVAPQGRVALTFHNLDAGVPHNVAIKDAGGSVVFEGEIITGPADMDIVLRDLSAGAYTFTCTVHPTMTGTLTVVP